MFNDRPNLTEALIQPAQPAIVAYCGSSVPIQYFFFDPMAWRGGGNFLLCVGLFLIASYECARLTKLKALDEKKINLTLSHSQSKGNGVSHGKLIIGQNSVRVVQLKGSKAAKNLLDVAADYQADMGMEIKNLCTNLHGKTTACLYLDLF